MTVKKSVKIFPWSRTRKRRQTKRAALNGGSTNSWLLSPALACVVALSREGTRLVLSSALARLVQIVFKRDFIGVVQCERFLSRIGERQEH